MSMSINNNKSKNNIINPIGIKSQQFYEVSKPDFLVTLKKENLIKNLSKKMNMPSQINNKNIKEKAINNNDEIELSDFPDNKNSSSNGILEFLNGNSNSNRNYKNKNLIHVKVKHQFTGRNKNKKQRLLFNHLNNSIKNENSLNNTSNNLLNISNTSVDKNKLEQSLILNNSKLISEKNKLNTILTKKPISVLKKYNLNPIRNKILNENFDNKQHHSFSSKKRNNSRLNEKILLSLTYDLKDKKIPSIKEKENKNSIFPYYHTKNKSNSNLNSSIQININKKEEIRKKLLHLNNKTNISPLLKELSKSIRNASNSTSNNSKINGKIMNSQKIQNKNNKIIKENQFSKTNRIENRIQKIIKEKKTKLDYETKSTKSKKQMNKTQIITNTININEINYKNENNINEEQEEKIYSPIRIIQSTKTKNLYHKTIIYSNNIKNHINENNPNVDKEKELIEINSKSEKGYEPENIKKINQDNYIIIKNFLSPKNTLIMVCDGHGNFGYEVSLYITKSLPNKLSNNLLSYIQNNENIENIPYPEKKNIFQKTFKQLNNKLTLSSIDTKFSGSTCITLLITESKIITSNLGDSRAMLCKCIDGFNWTYIPLSKDHKPNIPEEKNRIEKNNGRVSPYIDKYGNLIGPMRVWYNNNNYPGLAMSRSFGDEIAHFVGVSDECDVWEIELKNEDKFIVVGSDGLWEFFSMEEITNVVKDFYLSNNSKDAVQFLVQESRKRWLKEENICDDITVIVGFFN